MNSKKLPKKSIIITLLSAVALLSIILVVFNKSPETALNTYATSNTTVKESTNHEETHPSPELFVNKSEQLLNEGKLKESLLTLFEAKDILGNSEIIQKGIDSYWDRISLVPSVNFDECRADFCFEDTTYPKTEECTDGNIGLILLDNKNNTKETIAQITLKYNPGYSPKDSDITIVGNNDDTWLFYSFSGAGKCSAFLYTIHTNTLTILEDSPVNWHITDDIIIGTTISFAVGNEVSMIAYDWDGNILYKKENILSGTTVKDGWLFFAKPTYNENKTIYEIYKMKPDGTDEQLVCFIEASNNSYLGIDGDNIIWYDHDTDYKMSLSKTHNVTLNEPTNGKTDKEHSQENSSNDTQKLIDSALILLQNKYPEEKIYDLTFYDETDTKIICNVKAETNSFVIGVEINKSTKTVSVFNMSGREIDTFLLQ